MRSRKCLGSRGQGWQYGQQMQTLDKRRYREQAEGTGKRLEPKGNVVGHKDRVALSWASEGIRTQPANRADLTCCVIQAKRGKPVALPRQGQGSRKANCWGGGHGKVEKAKAVL